MRSHRWPTSTKFRRVSGIAFDAAARVGLANHEAIAAAKAGVVGLTLSAASTYARTRIRFNCVAPGLVRTPLAAGLLSSELAEKASVSMHPLGRIGEPEDVSSTVCSSRSNSWVTGQILGVDGGLADLKAKVKPAYTSLFAESPKCS